MATQPKRPTAQAARPARRRRWLWVLILLLVLGAVGGGAFWALRRGQKRSGVYDRAVAALQAGKSAEAEALLEQVLATTPDSRLVRQRLLDLYLEGGRLPEAEAFAREWVAVSPASAPAYRGLVEVNLRLGRFDEAERVARGVADLDPSVGLLTIIRVREMRGGARDRAQAIEAAIALASQARDGAVKGELLVYSAETLYDLAAEAPEAARPAMIKRARQYLEEAQRTLKGKDVSGRPSSASGKVLRDLEARALLFSDSAERVEFATKTLEESVAKESESHDARAALVAHYARQGAFEKALPHVEKLATGPLTVWLRAIGRLQRGGAPRETLIALVGANEHLRELKPAALIRASLLLGGDEAQKAEGVRLLQGIVRDSKGEPGLGVEAFRMLPRDDRDAVSGDLLEVMSGGGADARTGALAGAMLSAGELNDPRLTSLVAALPGKVGNVRETAEVLAILRQGNPATLEAFLSAAPPDEGAEGLTYRIRRAAAAAFVAASAPKAPGTEVLRAAALRDLEAVAAGGADGKALDAAWTLALLEGHRVLAGRLLALALGAKEASTAAAFAVLLLADRTPTEAERVELASGIEAAAEESPAPALARVVATAVRSGGTRAAGLMESLERATAEPAGAPVALGTLVRLHFRAEDVPAAEAAARRLLATAPGSADHAELLASVLITKQAWDDALTVIASVPEPTLALRRQRVVALLESGKWKEAHEAARESVRLAPDDARSALILAETYRRDPSGPKEAESLSVLSQAPQVPAVVMERARLLAKRGELAVAEMLYTGLLMGRPDDLGAWRGMGVVRGAQRRNEDFVALLTRRIEAKERGPAPATRAQLLAMRGSTYELLERPTEALADYEAALGSDPELVLALNNAAWLIVQTRKARVADARAFIDRALKLAPRHASVLDTAAEVYLAAGETGKALELADQAIAAAPNRASYLLRRARILVKAGDLAKAREQFEAILKLKDLTPSSPEYRAAMEYLGR